MVADTSGHVFNYSSGLYGMVMLYALNVVALNHKGKG